MSFPGALGPASSGLSVWRVSPRPPPQREPCVLSPRRSSCRRARGWESAAFRPKSRVGGGG